MAIFIFIGLLVTCSPIWHQFHCRVLLCSGRTVFLKTVIFGELWCLPYWPDLEVDGILQIQLFFKIIQLSCSMQFKTPTLWSRLEGQIWFRLDNPPGFENETRIIWCRLDFKKNWIRCTPILNSRADNKLSATFVHKHFIGKRHCCRRKSFLQSL